MSGKQEKQLRAAVTCIQILVARGVPLDEATEIAIRLVTGGEVQPQYRDVNPWAKDV